jgi:hypothetical protein
MTADPKLLDACLSEGSAFTLKDNHLAYELLLDIELFIFETRSLYEIVGKFLAELLGTLFNRKVTQKELQTLLASQGIDTRWIDELSEARKLFFTKQPLGLPSGWNRRTIALILFF